MTNEDKIYSNDYADIVAVNSTFLSYGQGSVPSEAFVQYINDKYAIIHISRQELDEYDISVRGYEPFVMGLNQSYLSDAGITPVLNQASLGVDGTGVLIAVIDTGINFTDTAFVYPDNTTKIVACWNQEDREGEPPQGQLYGTEFTREQINSALANNAVLSINDRTGHGTLLSRVALSAAPQAELIVVKLKQAKEYLIQDNLLNPTTAFQSSDVMTALDYVIEKAQQLNRPVSVVIGLGTSQGAHNGLSLWEQYIDDLTAATGVCITIGTGNEGVAQHHFFAQPTQEQLAVEISVENSDGFTVWLWNDYFCRMSIGVTSPLSEEIQLVQPVNLDVSRVDLPLGSGEVTIEYRLPVYEKQLGIVTIRNPVDGIWRLNLGFNRSSTVGIGCVVDAWLPITQLLNGRVIFLNPSTASTLTVPSSANFVMAVGGYNGTSGGIYSNTGRGPNTRGVIRPDFVAPAVEIENTSGTSLAAAITAGAGALLLQWGIVLGNNTTINTEYIKTYLTAGAQQPTSAGGQGFPNNLWGYGTLDLYNSFRQLL